VSDRPTNDVDRFNRLLDLSERGVLSDDEESPLNKVRHAATIWGVFGSAYGLMMAAMVARQAQRWGVQAKPVGYQYRPWWYFSAAERAQIDAIISAHQHE
jgi:hypothetical protein